MDTLLDMESSLRTAAEPRMPESPVQPPMLSDASPAAPIPLRPDAQTPPVEGGLSSPPLPESAVIPAKAGIQGPGDINPASTLDPRLRGEDSLPAPELPVTPEGLASKLAKADAVAGNLNIAAVPDKLLESGVEPISPEVLENSTGGPLPASRNVYDSGLPDASALIALLDAAPSAPAVPQIQVAQAGDVSLPVAPSSEADAALATAAALRGAGDFSGSALAYIQVMEQYPNEPAAIKQADRGIVQFVKDLTAGTLQREQMAVFESRLATWTPANAQAGYGALTYLGRRAEELQDGGADVEVYTDYARRTIDLAARVTTLDPFHPKQLGVTDYYFVSAKRLAPVERNRAMEAFANLTHELPPSIGRLAANFMLGTFEGTMHNGRGMATVYYANVVRAGREPFVEETLRDVKVEPWLKGMLGHVIGAAYAGLGDESAAIEAYEKALAYTSDAGSTREMLELAIAGARASQLKTQPVEAVRGYNDFLAKFPEGKRAPQALVELAAIYMTAGDYAGAATIYREIVERWPKSSRAEDARSELEYLETNLLQSRPVASLLPPTTEDTAMAMRCGPDALALLLAASNINAASDKLAQLAGTDATGTSMLGLVEAANAKGIALSGVVAPSVDLLSPPFIAYVNGNHFVVVTDRDEKGIILSDRAEGERRVSRSAFGAMWSGMALAIEPQGQHPLEVAALAAARGGTTGGPAQDDDPPCIEQAVNDFESSGRSLRRWIKRGGLDDFLCCLDSGGKCKGNVCAAPPGGNPPPNGMVGAMASPTSSTSVVGPGVNPVINTFQTALKLRERDLSVPVLGVLQLTFTRTYINELGWQRGEYESTSKPWQNNVGNGWTHNLNSHIRTDDNDDPIFVSVYDTQGSARTYIYDSTTGGYDIYTRHDDGQSFEQDRVLKRDTTTKAFILDGGDGIYYHYSAATTDVYRFARLEAIKDEAGNAITLSYSGAVGSGKLLTATSPGGDYTLNFTYSGTLISKVELKKSTTVLNSVQFTYTSEELIGVEDHAGKTVAYEYGTYEHHFTHEEYGRFITKITDKAGRESDFEWTWNTTGTGQATAIKVTNEDGLATTYARSLTTNVATISNYDGVTHLSKFVNTPLSSSDLARSKYHDYYLDATTYERWEYQYDTDSFLTKVIAPNSADYWTMTYNTDGQMLTKQFGTGPEETWEYDADGRVAKYIDTAGIETEFEYNVDGLVEKVSHPSVDADGYQYEYDAYGQVSKEISPLGTETTYSYDGEGHLEEMVLDAGGLDITTSYVYDDLGNMIQMTDPRGKVTEYEYGDPSCGACGGGAALEKVTDALGHESESVYNALGQIETTIDAAGIETDYTYDIMGRLSTITHPAGSGITATVTYNKLGKVATRIDFGGNTTSYEYDHMGRTVKVTDAVGDIEYVYNSLGLLTSVIDSLGHETTNTYDTAFRLSEVTDEIGKETHYAYDAAGRVESVGAGTSGTVDPTSYAYSVTTGLLESVEYGSSPYTANHEYDGEARLVKLTDWLDAVDGLRYAYDAVGRLTTLTDYDDSDLTYTYDDAGNVSSMVDYHGNTTSYTYNDIGQLATLTAPGSKVWTYTYDLGNRLTQVDIPNGMHTEYTYDASGRQDSIHHKDGATVKQGFDYTFDDGGNITRIDQEDGSYWEYDYDGRERLTDAVRGNHATPTILATYEYSYDDADNMLTKKVPWYDDFEDGNHTGWSGNTANYSVSGGVLKNTLDTTVRDLYLSETDADHDLSFDYVRYSSAGRVDVYLRTIDGNNRLYLEINPGNIKLQQVDGGTSSTLATYTTTVAQNTWYKLRAVLDGASVKIYWGANGASFNDIISATTTKTTTVRACYLRSQANSEHGFDNIQLIAGTRSTTETFTYNNANEQITHAKNGVTTTATYDAWGRLATRDDGTHDATYAYRYGSKLYSVASDFPNEGNVTYESGGDGKRRSRVAGADETWYNYTRGFDVVSTENDSDGVTGALTKSSIVLRPTFEVSATIGDLAGTSPASGLARYYSLDHLGSARSVWSSAKAGIGNYEFDPYGNEFFHTGVASASLAVSFGNKAWDQTSGLLHFPYREYSPSQMRWTTRDPLGMVDGPNIFAYVLGDPINSYDLTGRTTGDGNWINTLLGILWSIISPRGAPPLPGPEHAAAAIDCQCIAYSEAAKKATAALNKCLDDNACVNSTKLADLVKAEAEAKRKMSECQRMSPTTGPGSGR